MARIKVSVSANSKSYTIIDDYNRNGKRTTKVIDRIGNYEKVSSMAKQEGIDVDTWLKNYLISFLKEHNMSTTNEKVIIEKNANRLIPMNIINKFNVGYLFLEDIYYSLKLDKIIKDISKKYKFEFDLNEVLSNLIFQELFILLLN